VLCINMQSVVSDAISYVCPGATSGVTSGATDTQKMATDNQ